MKYIKNSLLFSVVFFASALYADCPVLREDSAQDLYNRAIEYCSAGKYKQAIACLRGACAKDPNHKQACYQLAQTYLMCSQCNRGFDIMHEYMMKEQPLGKTMEMRGFMW